MRGMEEMFVIPPLLGNKLSSTKKKGCDKRSQAWGQKIAERLIGQSGGTRLLTYHMAKQISNMDEEKLG